MVHQIVVRLNANYFARVHAHLHLDQVRIEQYVVLYRRKIDHRHTVVTLIKTRLHMPIAA